MKIVKRLLLGSVVLVVALAAAVVFVASSIDPNDYKQEIQAAVEQATGRKLHIEGGIELTVFPTLNLDLERVALDNPAGFEGRFASAERVFAGLNLLPLLQRRLEIGKVTLRKPRLALSTLSDGRTNWQDLAAQDSEESPAPALLAGFSLAGLAIEDAGVVWRDERAREHIRAAGVTLKTGALASGKPVKLSLDGTVSDERRGLSADLSLGATVSVDLENRRAVVDGLDFAIRLRDGDTQPVNVTVNADATVDLAADRATLRGLSVTVADTHISGSAEVAGLSAKAKIAFALASDDLAPLKLAAALKMPTAHLPPQAKLEIDATVDLAADRATLRGLSVTVADTHISGSAEVAGLSAKAKIAFALASDDLAPLKLAAALKMPTAHLPPQAKLEIDATVDLAADAGTLNRLSVAVGGARIEGNGRVNGLLSDDPKVNASVKTNVFDLRALAETLNGSLPDTADDKAFRKFAAAGDFTVAPGNEGGATIHRSDVTLDDSRLRVQGGLAWLPTLRITLDGELDRIDASRYLPPGDATAPAGDLQITGLRAQVRAGDGKVGVTVPAVRVFGGRFDGTFSFDAGTGAAQPVWRSRGQATGVKIERVLAALAVENEKLLKGIGSLTYKLSAAGDDEPALTQSLAGSVKLELVKGAFKNPRLAQATERVIAFFQKRPAGNAGAELIFNRAAANFSIKQGVADNRDLEVDMPLLHLRGAGRMDLARARVDYQLRAGLLRQKPGERIYVPIKITGAFDDPQYSVDFKQVVRREAGRRIKREVEKGKEKVKEKIKDRIGDILKNKLLKLPL